MPALLILDITHRFGSFISLAIYTTASFLGSVPIRLVSVSPIPSVLSFSLIADQNCRAQFTCVRFRYFG